MRQSRFIIASPSRSCRERQRGTAQAVPARRPADLVIMSFAVEQTLRSYSNRRSGWLLQQKRGGSDQVRKLVTHCPGNADPLRRVPRQDRTEGVIADRRAHTKSTVGRWLGAPVVIITSPPTMAGDES